MQPPSWKERVSGSKGDTVDRLLAGITRDDLKLKNLETVRARKAVFEGFHTIDFGAIQLSEQTIRDIARECGIEKLLKPSKKDPEHLAISRITPPFGQLYTQANHGGDDHAGTRIDIRPLKHISATQLRGLAAFMDEITRLREGIIAAADVFTLEPERAPAKPPRGKGSRAR